MQALSITVPIFALIGLGWLGARLRLLDNRAAEGLAAFVFWLAFPALLLGSMAKAPAPDGAMAQAVGLWLVVLLGAQAAARLLGLMLRWDAQVSSGVALAASNGNTAFLGTAILASLLSPDHLGVVAAFVAVENIIAVGVAVAALRASDPQSDGSKVLAATLKGLANPISMGALIGFGLAVSGWGLAPWLARPIDMLGAAASPAGLVSLGIVIALTKPGGGAEQRGPVVWAIGLKCVALPVAMFAAFTLAGFSNDIRLAATLLAACPCAINVYIQARQAGVWAGPAAMAVIGSTLVSLIGLTMAAGLA